jgi:hypothetical protein
MTNAIKLEKQLGSEYVDSLRALPKKELEFKLLELMKHSQAIDETKERDKDLIDAKNTYDEYKAPYTEQKSQNKKKQKMIYLILKDMGE